jgi:hypothetical protein
VGQEGWRYENLKEWKNMEKPAFDERTEVSEINYEGVCVG